MYIVQCILKEVSSFLQSVARAKAKAATVCNQESKTDLSTSSGETRAPVLASCPRFYVPFLEILREEKMQNCVQDLMWPVVSFFLDLNLGRLVAEVPSPAKPPHFNQIPNKIVHIRTCNEE